MADGSANRGGWLWKLFRPHLGALWGGLLATVLCSIAASFVPYWAGRAVDSLGKKHWHDSHSDLIWLLAFTAVAGVGRYFMRNILIGLSRAIEKEQRESLYAFLLSRPFAFYERNRVGDLMTRMGDDISTVRMATGPGFMSLLTAVSILPVTLGLMLHTSWRLTVAVMLPFSLLPLGFYALGRWSHRIQQRLQLAFSALSSFSQETISGQKVVQAFSLEDQRVEKFHELSTRHAGLAMTQTVLTGAYGPMAMFISGAALLVLVAYGGGLYINQRILAGDFVAFNGYLVAMAWPVMSLGWAANLFQRAKAGQARLEQIQEPLDAGLPPVVPIALPDHPAALRVEGLEHRFASGRGVGPLDLDIPGGGSLAIVGGIGSGKTILLQMLAGLREPQNGRLLVDGSPLHQETLRRHWAGLGWVPQEAFLFSDSLRFNLAMGRPEATDEEIWEIARVVCLDELITRLPQGLDTVVGERGVILSGGERQRTALARALLRKPRLLLLDDCLSAVDAETESRILDNLKTFLGTTTLLLATHRIFVAELCERVLVLEDGAVAQLGTPGELESQPGRYARLKKLQSLERELVKGA